MRALPAAAAATALPAIALAASNPDAELIALGKQFDTLRAAWLPLWRDMWRLDAEWRGLIEERGLSLDRDSEAWQIHNEVGVTAAMDRADAALLPLEEIGQRILSIKPQTLAGLAVWAKATRSEAVSADAADTPEEEWHHLDWNEERVMRFLAEVERLAGASCAS
ncbi:MAG TPA: hypothetical protein VGN97_15600 [Mesorhizobium sp.]|nr:hypothetical protein [Mesorhizobium sp.]